MEQTKINCENKLHKIADNFKGMQSYLYSIGIIDEIQAELTGSNSIAAFSIQKAIEAKEDTLKVVKCAKEMIIDGWDELSLQLTDRILKFKP